MRNQDVNSTEEKTENHEAPADSVGPRHFELHSVARPSWEKGRVAIDQVPEDRLHSQRPIVEPNLEVEDVFRELRRKENDPKRNERQDGRPYPYDDEEN
jgi:hypothetical protein